jgi:CMP-N-acetylneuraminic acid synthetase
MQVPNWKHHSRKEQKRKLKPQALRQAKARRQALKKKHSERGVFFINKTKIKNAQKQI